MSIKSLRIETVFSGGIHLIWITLFLLCLLGESPETILCYLSKIQSGMAVILVTILFSLSFFLGRISEHLLIAYNYYCRKSCIEKREARGGEWNMSSGFAVAAMKQRKKRKKKEELEERVRKLEEEVEKLKKQQE